MSELKEIRLPANATLQAYIDYVHSYCKQKGIAQDNAYAITINHLSHSNIPPKLIDLIPGVEVDYVAAYEYVNKGKLHLHHWHLLTNAPIIDCDYCEPVNDLSRYVNYIVKQALIHKNSLYHHSSTTTKAIAEPELHGINSNDRIKIKSATTNAMDKIFHRFYYWINKPILKVNYENITLFMNELNSNKSKPKITMNLSQEIQDGYNAAYTGHYLTGDESPFFVEGYSRAMQEKQERLTEFLNSSEAKEKEKTTTV